MKDVVTGIQGIATAGVFYMNGCLQIEITPTAKKDGQRVSTIWVDFAQVKRVKINPHGLRPSSLVGAPDWFGTAAGDNEPTPRRRVASRPKTGGPQSRPSGPRHP